MGIDTIVADLKSKLEAIDLNLIARSYPGALEKVQRLESIQGHSYASKKVALVSLMHRSVLVKWPGCRDGSVQSNERLEFLGDALIGFFIAMQAMSARPDLEEGSLTKLRSALVGTTNLSAKALELGLGKCLLLGKGEHSSGGQQRSSILADLFEATTAALFLDAGHIGAWQWLQRVFEEDFACTEQTLAGFDAKTRFQQWTQSVIGIPPVYRVVGTVGTPESTEFIMAAFIGETEIARSQGRNKRDASKQVAAIMQAMVDAGELTANRLREIARA
jgi:dsRNA-specific ribonuclease